jgi:hypothetical protein
MIRRLLVVVAVGSAVAACSSPTGTTTVLPSAAGTTSAASTASKSSTPVSTQASRRGTAEQDLAPFLAEVRQADARLRHAAALINAGIGAAVVLVDQVTATAVRAAQPDTAAARAVPRGLAPELLRRTLVVYHDLVARHAAMGYFLAPGSHPRGSGSGVSSAAGLMLECLANGAAPASRFAADLASLEQYARTPAGHHRGAGRRCGRGGARRASPADRRSQPLCRRVRVGRLHQPRKGHLDGQAHG